MRPIPLALTFGILAGSLGGQTVDFTRDVQPIFAESCFGCHGAKVEMGGLRLDSKSRAAEVIQPSNAAGSTLYQRVAGGGSRS